MTIQPTPADIGRTVIYKSRYDEIKEEGVLSSIGQYFIYVRFSNGIYARSGPIACPRNCLHWPKEKDDPCLLEDFAAGSDSPATQSDAIQSGIPLPTAPDQSIQNSSTVGTKPRLEDGEQELPEKQIKGGIRNGLIDARAASFKLPAVNVNRRSEVAAFIEGYCLCFRSIAHMFDPDETVSLMRMVGQLAVELYPNYDPLPEPSKRRDGAIDY